MIESCDIGMTHHNVEEFSRIFRNFDFWIVNDSMNERLSKIVSQPIQTEVIRDKGRVFNVKIGTRLLTTTLLLSQALWLSISGAHYTLNYIY